MSANRAARRRGEAPPGSVLVVTIYNDGTEYKIHDGDPRRPRSCVEVTDAYEVHRMAIETKDGRKLQGFFVGRKPPAPALVLEGAAAQAVQP